MPKPIMHTFYNYDAATDSETEEVVEIPTVNAVCNECHGEGKSSAHLGVLSDEDSQDYEFMDLYISGAYDKTCDACKGKRVVAVPDENWLDRNPNIRDRWEEDMTEKARYEAECRMERRMFGG